VLEWEKIPKVYIVFLPDACVMIGGIIMRREKAEVETHKGIVVSE
jgi:cytochrome c oxidase subunit IV